MFVGVSFSLFFRWVLYGPRSPRRLARYPLLFIQGFSLVQRSGTSTAENSGRLRPMIYLHNTEQWNKSHVITTGLCRYWELTYPRSLSMLSIERCSDLTNDTVENRASTHAVEKRFFKTFKAKRQKGFIIALLSASCPKWLQIESFVSKLESNDKIIFEI